MPGWAWALVVAAAVVVTAVVVWQALRAGRTRTLKQRFGPEYERTVAATDNRSDAEAELEARAKRRERLDIRPLSAAARGRYLEEWRQVQARFVDDPGGAVQQSDVLIQSVMRERGYPVEDFDQRAADVSVDHPAVVENYRAGHRLAAGDGETEDLRQAMVHYRALFQELVEQSEDEPLQRDDAAPVETTDREVMR